MKKDDLEIGEIVILNRKFINSWNQQVGIGMYITPRITSNCVVLAGLVSGGNIKIKPQGHVFSIQIPRSLVRRPRRKTKKAIKKTKEK